MGHTPTPTFLGPASPMDAVAFFKAVGPMSNAFSRAAHDREERRSTGEPGRRDRAPGRLVLWGAFHQDGWKAICSRTSGPNSAPPWNLVARAQGSARVRRIPTRRPSARLCRFGSPDRGGMSWGIASTWKRLLDEEDLPVVADLAGDQARPAALEWLESAAPILARVSRDLVAANPPFAFLHRDARSDNLRWLDGRLRLFDWPHVGVGPAEFDAAAFAQSVTAEDGPRPVGHGVVRGAGASQGGRRGRLGRGARRLFCHARRRTGYSGSPSPPRVPAAAASGDAGLGRPEFWALASRTG